MDFSKIGELAIGLLTQFGFKLLGGIALWIIGQNLIDFVQHLIRRSVRGQAIDPTMINYLISGISITLRIILVVALLGFFGIQTTSFAALLAAAGIAIGAAWGGMLANFAAGVFLVLFRPFKVGDFISAAGVTGTVHEIGLFATTMNTPENVMTIVGNNKLLGDNIQNYSANAYRRINLTAQLNASVDPRQAIVLLQEKISQIPNIMTDPAPVVDILEFNLAGTVLAVRPCCHTKDYWQVYFATNRTIYETFGNAGYPPPQQHYILHRGDAGWIDR